jgi:hypothetical protein
VSMPLSTSNIEGGSRNKSNLVKPMNSDSKILDKTGSESMLKTTYKPIIQLKSPLDRSMKDEKISRSPYTNRNYRRYQYKVFQYNENDEKKSDFV